MLPVFLGMLGGAWLVGRGKPRTRVQKKKCLGPATGRTYEVDDMTQAGVIVVTHVNPIATVTFVRTPQGFRHVKASGHPELVKGMLHDFASRTAAKPRAVPDEPPQDVGTGSTGI